MKVSVFLSELLPAFSGRQNLFYSVPEDFGEK